MNHYPLAKLPEVLEMFKRNCEEFTMIQTSRSAQIKAGSIKVLLAESVFPVQVLGLMRSLKCHVKKRIGEIHILEGRPRYYLFRPDLRSKLGSGAVDAMEYDIQSAYLESLKAIGGIDLEMYAKLHKVEKKYRLAIVGSLATKKTITEYRNGNPVNTITERDEELFRVWKSVTIYTDNLMLTLYTQDRESLFYWVDALFTTNERILTGVKSQEVKLSIPNSRPFVHVNDGRFFPITTREAYREPVE